MYVGAEEEGGIAIAIDKNVANPPFSKRIITIPFPSFSFNLIVFLFFIKNRGWEILEENSERFSRDV